MIHWIKVSKPPEGTIHKLLIECRCGFQGRAFDEEEKNNIVEKHIASHKNETWKEK